MINIVGKPEGFDAEAPVQVTFARPAFVYNLGTSRPAGEPLGALEVATVTAAGFGPIILAQTDQPITGIPLSVEYDSGVMYITATISARDPVGDRLLAVQLVGPSGRNVPQLGRTIAAQKGRALASVAMPVNAPPGIWRVIVGDLATGMAAWADVAVR
jgi:hypothetical protein